MLVFMFSACLNSPRGICYDQLRGSFVESQCCFPGQNHVTMGRFGEAADLSTIGYIVPRIFGKDYN